MQSPFSTPADADSQAPPSPLAEPIVAPQVLAEPPALPADTLVTQPNHNASRESFATDSPWKLGEPDAVAAPRPAALAPLNAMLLGGALSCVLIGAGFFLGVRNRGGVLDPVQQIGGTYGAANADSGNAIVQAVRLIGPSVMNVDTTFGSTW